jgi:uncharacterized protein (DUF39 family)
VIAEVTYQELKSGTIVVQVQRNPHSRQCPAIKKQRDADMLKTWIQEGNFELSEPARLLRS